MRFIYYNLEKDGFNKNHRKGKFYTISFNHIIERIQFENSDRGVLLWVNTPKTIRVFGYWKQGGCCGSKRFYQSWNNDHIECG